MSFGDMFRKSFLEGYQPANITTSYVIITLAITGIISLYIFCIYRLTAKKIFYSLNFNISLVATALITSTIIFTIQSSIVISLGMVGALSIVRFRTAVKDPLDLVYLFWAISTGIVCGAGLAQFAIILSIILTIVIISLSCLKEFTQPHILVVNAKTSGVEKEIIQYAKENFGKYKIKSRNVNLTSYNIVIEFTSSDENTVISDIEGIEEVYSVSVVSHNGEVTY